MSQNFSIVCHETKRRIWIGQGRGQMETIYMNEFDALELRTFLNQHIGKPLEFVCLDKESDEVAEYEEFK